MRTSEQLVESLHQRMNTERRRKVRRKYRIISSAAVTSCLILTVLVAVLVSRNPADGSEAIIGSASASIFAENAALGYVAVSLVAFCLGVLVTVFCMRLESHAEEEGRDDARPD